MSIDLIGREINGVLHKPKKQLAMVFDLNKCLGCHTCAMSCKTLWTDGEGQEDMWWNVVNTMREREPQKAGKIWAVVFKTMARCVRA